MAEMLAAEASLKAIQVCMHTLGSFGLAAKYDVERKLPVTPLIQVAPTSTNLIFSPMS
jgi:acyl-CoA dehydrogenase